MEEETRKALEVLNFQVQEEARAKLTNSLAALKIERPAKVDEGYALGVYTNYAPYLIKLAEFKTKIEAFELAGDSDYQRAQDADGQQKAKQAKSAVAKLRLELVALTTAHKEDPLTTQKLINSIEKPFEALCKSLEGKLGKLADYASAYEQSKIDALAKERHAMLAIYGEHVEGDLGRMTDDQFEGYRMVLEKRAKVSTELRRQEAEKAEAEAKALREKQEQERAENERLRAENARLHKLEEERKAEDALARQQAAELLEAGDAGRFKLVLAQLEGVKFPDFESEKAKTAAAGMKQRIDAMIEYINANW
jgi:hypothetical protein